MRTAYISLLDIGSRMARAMQVMKNAQAWAKSSSDFEFVTSLSLANSFRLDWDRVSELYGLGVDFPVKTWPLRRQDKPRGYARNGPAVLALRRETALARNTLYGPRTLPLVMAPAESLDIDSPLDLELAQWLLSRREGSGEGGAA